MFGVLYKYFPLHFQYLAESSISNKQFIFLIKKIFKETGYKISIFLPASSRSKDDIFFISIFLFCRISHHILQAH